MEENKNEICKQQVLQVFSELPQEQWGDVAKVISNIRARLSSEDLCRLFTEQQWKDIFELVKTHPKLSREKMADAMYSTKYILREIAKFLGIVLPQGKPVKIRKFATSATTEQSN